MLLGNLKRAISGSYHAIRQGKYARLYLAEAAYRFNRRFDLRALLPRLARDDAVQVSSGADSAHGEQFSWLRIRANQVG